jgi:hypothetical protein
MLVPFSFGSLRNSKSYNKYAVMLLAGMEREHTNHTFFNHFGPVVCGFCWHFLSGKLYEQGQIHLKNESRKSKESKEKILWKLKLK